MKLSILFKEIESRLGVKVIGRPFEKEVDSVKFLTSDSANEYASANVKTLYLGDYSTSYNFSPEQIVLFVNSQITDPNIDGVYNIREDISLLKIFNIFQDLNISEGKISLYKDRLFNMLYSGCNIREILKEAYSVLENPITLSDSTFTQIDEYPSDHTDMEHFEDINGNLILRPSYLQDMVDFNLIPKLDKVSSSFVTNLEGSSFKWIFSGVKVGNSIFAYICIRCIYREYSNFDIEYSKILCKVISIILQKQDIFKSSTGLSVEYFFKTLLENKYREKSYIQQRLNLFGVKVNSFNHLLVINSVESITKSTNTLYINQIKSIFSNSIITNFQDRITLLLQTETQIPFTQEKGSRFSTFLKMNKLHCGVSYPFTDLKDTNNFYHQALDLCTQTQLFDEHNPLLMFSDYYMEDIFNEINNLEYLKSMIHPDILYISDYDNRHNSEYFKTLRTYLSNNRNAADSAVELNIHRSTFFYRLKKIVSLLNFKEDDSKLLFSYEFSFRLLDYIKGLDYI